MEIERQETEKAKETETYEIKVNKNEKFYKSRKSWTKWSRVTEQSS